MDFWAALGIGQESEDQPDAAPPQAPRPETIAGRTGAEDGTGRPAEAPVGGSGEPENDHAGAAAPARQAAPPRRSGTAAPSTARPGAAQATAPDDWAAMFSGSDTRPPGGSSAGTRSKPSARTNGTASTRTPGAAPTRTPGAASTRTNGTASTPAPGTASTRAPGAAPTGTSGVVAARTPDVPAVAGPASGSAPDGPPAGGVLGGWDAFARLWQDEHVTEVHIRGTAMVAYGPRGVRPVAHFADAAAARATIAAIIAVQEETGATVTRAGESVIIARRHGGGLTPDDLLAAGVVTKEQLTAVEEALAATRSVTVTGPAAPVIVRTLASLIPAGSRVYEAPFGTLPAGCVAAASPLDADYVVGVRPGTVVEEMAAAGQIGALIANPAAPYAAAVCLTVSGRSAALGKVTTSANG
jgi:hypothetical protein